jgi:hypothetical protein
MMFASSMFCKLSSFSTLRWSRRSRIISPTSTPNDVPSHINIIVIGGSTTGGVVRRFLLVPCRRRSFSRACLGSTFFAHAQEDNTELRPSANRYISLLQFLNRTDRKLNENLPAFMKFLMYFIVSLMEGEALSLDHLPSNLCFVFSITHNVQIRLLAAKHAADWLTSHLLSTEDGSF